MPLCLAMVRASSDANPNIQILRRCRCNARTNKDTCGTHKNFFNTATWVQNVLCGNYFPSLSLESRDPSTKFHVEHISEAILSGRVVLSKDDVKSIPAESKNIDVLRLLSCFTSINPLWNIRLLAHVLVHYTWLMTNQIPCENYLNSILQNVNVSPLTFVRMFLPYWGDVKKMRPILDLILKDFLENQPKLWEISLYHEKFIMKYLTEESLPDVPEYVSTELLPLIRENRKIAKQVRKDRMDAIKEELMMKMWAPERIEAYNEKYGIFLLDECDPWLMAVARGPRA